jgi:hypothetical protein
MAPVPAVPIPAGGGAVLDRLPPLLLDAFALLTLAPVAPLRLLDTAVLTLGPFAPLLLAAAFPLLALDRLALLALDPLALLALGLAPLLLSGALALLALDRFALLALPGVPLPLLVLGAPLVLLGFTALTLDVAFLLASRIGVDRGRRRTAARIHRATAAVELLRVLPHVAAAALRQGRPADERHAKRAPEAEGYDLSKRIAHHRYVSLRRSVAGSSCCGTLSSVCSCGRLSAADCRRRE